jgi:hypothetical protein
VRRAAAHDPHTPPNRKQTRAALPPSVRKDYAFPLMPLFFEAAPPVMLRRSLKNFVT